MLEVGGGVMHSQIEQDTESSGNATGKSVCLVRDIRKQHTICGSLKLYETAEMHRDVTAA